jgi:hypothetical protein
MRRLNQEKKKAKYMKRGSFEPTQTTLELRKKEKSTFPILLGIILDTFAAVDFFSDLYIITKFLNSQHAFWLCANLQTIMWPFFVSQVPYLNFKLIELRNIFTKRGTSNRLKFVVGMTTLTPGLLFFFIFVDLTFLVISLILGLVYLGVKCFRMDIGTIFKMEECLETLYMNCFGLSKINLEGFRRMRTSSQLTFESFP